MTRLGAEPWQKLSPVKCHLSFFCFCFETHTFRNLNAIPDCTSLRFSSHYVASVSDYFDKGWPDHIPDYYWAKPGQAGPGETAAEWRQPFSDVLLNCSPGQRRCHRLLMFSPCSSSWKCVCTAAPVTHAELLHQTTCCSRWNDAG